MGVGLGWGPERTLVAETCGSLEACEVVLMEAMLMLLSLCWLAEADSAAESRSPGRRKEPRRGVR